MFANWCVFIAILLPYIWVGIAKAYAENMDVKQPRISLANQTGWIQRANWAQQNAFEVFPLFAAAVIIAQIQHGNAFMINCLATIFIIARILHGIAYINDWFPARVFAWFIGMISILSLFFV